jgi:hypothetical protein
MRRRFLPALAILGAFAAQPALAQKHCPLAADQATFEVQALRSHLVVLATGCPQTELYKAFIQKYQPTLQANAAAVAAWFKKRYGARGQVEHDKFVTELTNAMSSGATVLGGDFCPHDGALFDEVMALRSGNELASYAAAKDLVPASVEICPSQTTKPAPKPPVKR